MAWNRSIIKTINSHKRPVIIIVAAVAVLVWLWSLIYSVVMGLGYKDWLLFNQFVGGKIHSPLGQLIIYPNNAAVQKTAVISTLIILSPFIALLVAWKALTEKDSKDAHFQNILELAKNKFFDKTGVIIGAYKKRLLRSNAPAHHIVIGPTRSGKGAGYVIPNAIEYAGSMIVTDLKSEIFTATAGWRQKNGNDIYLFAPGERASDRYNPLSAVRNNDDANRVTDIQNIAIILLPITSDSENAVWQGQAQALLAALISYVLESGKCAKNQTLTQVLELVDKGVLLQKYVKMALKYEREDLSKFTKNGLGSFVSMTEKAALSILMDIRNSLAAFRNPLISAATAVTDIPLSELNKRPITIYLAPTITNITLVKPILTVFIQHVLSLLTQTLDEKAISVFFLLDEFRQLQRVDEVVTKLPYVAGYNIKFSFIIQELRMLDAIYTQAGRDSIMGNCAVQICMGANDETTARYVSTAAGKKIEQTMSQTRSGGFSGGINSKTTHKNMTELILPQEIRQMKNDREIILPEGHAPIFAEKIKYFEWKKYQLAVKYAKEHIPAIKTLDYKKYVTTSSDDEIVEEQLTREKEEADEKLAKAKQELQTLAAEKMKEKPDYRATILDLLDSTVPDPLPDE